MTYYISITLQLPVRALEVLRSLADFGFGPIPTFIISTPKFNKNFAASGVAIFPAHKAVFLDLILLINLTISETFLV